MYLGSTLSFAKSQAFEYQCTHEVGREGAGNISNAIGLGVIKHPELAIVEDNMWYTSVPTVLPTTKADNDLLNTYTDLINEFSAQKGDDKVNIWVDIITSGFNFEGFSDVEEAAETVADAWNDEAYLDIKNYAWWDILDYYESL